MLQTIKSSDEISYIFKYGKRFSSPYLTLIVFFNENKHDHTGRVAFIAGKKLGNAVWRNKAKRRMRSICQHLNGPWPNYDVIFLAKTQITVTSYSKVSIVCKNLLGKAGIHLS